MFNLTDIWCLCDWERGCSWDCSATRVVGCRFWDKEPCSEDFSVWWRLQGTYTWVRFLFKNNTLFQLFLLLLDHRFYFCFSDCLTFFYCQCSLYRGKVGLDVAEAQHLMDGLDWQGAVKDIQASVKWLKANGANKVCSDLPSHKLIVI